VSARIADSLAYAHLWGTEELRDVFTERGRLEGWLAVLAALARAQAAHGCIPAEAAAAITAEAMVDRLDLERIAEDTRLTGHSTQGLILELRRVLSPVAAAHVYRDATVQDVTDTWTALVLRTARA
jgi:adenylosuccinate lyase